MKKIVLLTASLFLVGTLAACTTATKQECWRAGNKTNKDCNSGGGGYSQPSPNTKATPVQRTKKDDNTPEDNTSPEDSLPDTGTTPGDDAPAPNATDNESDQDTGGQDEPDDGYNPFGGLYGPGT